jgi:hypothetical protein
MKREDFLRRKSKDLLKKQRETKRLMSKERTRLKPETT